MRDRGYLWTNLQEEIAEEFSRLSDGSGIVALDKVLYASLHNWTVGKLAVGRVKGRKETKAYVSDLRKRRREAGLCLDCPLPLHPKSKSYCPEHREADRLRAAKKRAARLVMRDLEGGGPNDGARNEVARGDPGP